MIALRWKIFIEQIQFKLLYNNQELCLSFHFPFFFFRKSFILKNNKETLQWVEQETQRRGMRKQNNNRSINYSFVHIQQHTEYFLHRVECCSRDEDICNHRKVEYVFPIAKIFHVLCSSRYISQRRYYLSLCNIKEVE